MKPDELKQWVIKPTLLHLGMHSESAVNLLLGTVAHESKMGAFLKQVGGPALGIYQIEPATLEDVYKNYLSYRPSLLKDIEALRAEGMTRDQSLINNLAYATAIARLVYRRVPEPLPAHDDIAGLAAYWKKHYNTYLGKGNRQQFMDAFPAEVLQ
ncbi:hypothetical protein [Endozoicomonas sp. ALB091]|uniref:hypothetical protein n=1 Tax=Endozoicomonas sp. ALB091 TaxID=3403073 RepID=UPI003BB60DF9